jgi:hypothetical protein
MKCTIGKGAIGSQGVGVKEGGNPTQIDTKCSGPHCSQAGLCSTLLHGSWGGIYIMPQNHIYSHHAHCQMFTHTSRVITTSTTALQHQSISDKYKVAAYL